eukprot:7800064-Pyramimonas_sp.AAC.1
MLRRSAVDRLTAVSHSATYFSRLIVISSGHTFRERTEYFRLCFQLCLRAHLDRALIRPEKCLAWHLLFATRRLLVYMLLHIAVRLLCCDIFDHDDAAADADDDDKGYDDDDDADDDNDDCVDYEHGGGNDAVDLDDWNGDGDDDDDADAND